MNLFIFFLVMVGSNTSTEDIEARIGLDTYKNPLFQLNKLCFSMNVAYITQVKELVGLPVTAIVLKPTIKYGDRWGVFADNLYASLNCVDSIEAIEAKIGLNYFNIAPFYKFDIEKVDLIGGIGILRVDIAGLLSGEYGGIVFGEVVNEERIGIYGSLRAGIDPLPLFRIKSSASTGIVPEGNFWEIGTSFMFKQFKGGSKERDDFKNHIFFSIGFSVMHFSIALESQPGESYSTFMLNYLIGVTYEG